MHVGWGKAMHEPPSSFMGSIPHDIYQLTFNYKKNNLNVWHIRPYHDTISHTIEHWLP